MEAENPYSLLSLNWRGREASGIIKFDFKGLRIRGASRVSPCPSPQTREPGEDGYPSSSKFALPLPFCFIQTVSILGEAHHIG